MNTAIRPEDMERYLREMRAFAKRAGYTISPPSPPAPPAVEEPPAPPATEEEPAQEPDTAPRYPEAPLEQERVHGRERRGRAGRAGRGRDAMRPL